MQTTQQLQRTYNGSILPRKHRHLSSKGNLEGNANREAEEAKI